MVGTPRAPELQRVSLVTIAPRTLRAGRLVVRARRTAWPEILATVLPALLVAYVAFATIHTQFFVDGPLLQDAGQYARITWRAGISPRNPPIGFPVDPYYGLHLAPLVGLASLASYLVPLDRVDWLALLAALACAPLGLAVGLLAPPGHDRRRAVITGLVAAIFALDGLTLVCLAFPHHELALAGGLALLVAGLARPSRRVAWLGLSLAIGAREDGGLHAATFLVAAALLARSGRPFPLPADERRRLLAAALACAAAAFALQALLFAPAHLFRDEYLGAPPLAHLGASALRARLARLPTDAAFVLFPLVGSAAVAALRRDPRYLLGWLATAPWLALNVLAAQDLKARLQLYTAFPCIASVLWVAAYGVRDGGRAWLVALPSLLATAGLACSSPPALGYVCDHALGLGRADRAAVHAFVERLARRPGALPYVDQGVASWLAGRYVAGDVVLDEARPADPARSGFAFFRTGMLWQGEILGWLARTPFSQCGRAVGTELYECLPEGAELDAALAPSSPLLRAAALAEGVAERRGEGVHIASTAPGALALFGPFLHLRAGTYRVTWRVQGEAAPPARVDVYRAGEVLATTDLAPATTELTAVVPEGAAPVELRLWTGGRELVVTGLLLRALPPTTAGR